MPYDGGTLVPYVHSVTFTPSVDGKVRVSASFTSQITSGSGDFGSSQYSKLFLLQNGVTTYGNQLGMSVTELPQNLVYDFDVVADDEVICGLYGAGGARFVRWTKINIVAQLIDES